MGKKNGEAEFEAATGGPHPSLDRAEAERRFNAALPDTEGPVTIYDGELQSEAFQRPDTEGDLRPVRPGPHIKAMPWSNEQTDSFLGDTEGEQDG